MRRWESILLSRAFAAPVKAALSAALSVASRKSGWPGGCGAAFWLLDIEAKNSRRHTDRGRRMLCRCDRRHDPCRPREKSGFLLNRIKRLAQPRALPLAPHGADAQDPSQTQSAHLCWVNAWSGRRNMHPSRWQGSDAQCHRRHEHRS